MKWFALSLFFSVVAFGEAAVVPRSGAWAGTGSYQDLLSRGSATSVEGTVLSTGQFRAEEGIEPGMQLNVATEKGDLTVHLGPRWFVLQNDLNFTRGEPLTIVGLKIQFNERPVIVATEVRKENRKIILRDLATGKPRW